MKEVEEILSGIYFHELESRERIFNRLQLNFAIYASAITILAYMARMIDYGSICSVITLFYVGLFAGIAIMAKSIYLSVIALTGYEYITFPLAREVVSYRAKLENHAKEIEKYNQDYNLSVEVPDPTKGVNEYAIKILSKCIDTNSKINEYRRKVIRKSVWCIMLAAIPIIFSATLFVVFDLDASSPRKNLLVEDKKLATEIKNFDIIIKNFEPKKITKEKDDMNDEQSNQNTKTPPPPPQPPKEPEVQISTEDLKASLPKKSEILNENK